jgi:hypothetical protein
MPTMSSPHMFHVDTCMRMMTVWPSPVHFTLGLFYLEKFGAVV